MPAQASIRTNNSTFMTSIQSANPLTDEPTLHPDYVSPGMPPIRKGNSTVSYFEFWPTWIMYFPVVFDWLYLSVRHRSLSLPLISNPRIPNSGMVGFSKNDFLAQASQNSQQYILPWITYQVSDQPTNKLTIYLLSLKARNLDFRLSANRIWDVGEPE